MSSEKQINYVNNLQNRTQNLYYIDDVSELNNINLKENDKVYAINDNKLFQMEVSDYEQELSGEVINFRGRNSTKIAALTVNIEPIQDLHGYDSPWPAGGGKNKFNCTLQSRTLNGITFTVNNGLITVTGTADALAAPTLGEITLSSGTYILTGCPSGGGISNYQIDTIEGIVGVSTTGNPTTFTLTEETTFHLRLRIANGYAAPSGGIVFSPMIRLASETDATFAPYANICPINGWTGASVTRTGDNMAPTVGWRVGGLTNSGQTSSSIHYAMFSPFIPCEPNTTYCFTVTGNGFKKRLCGYGTDQSNPMASTMGTITEDKTATITTGVNDRFLRLAVESIDQTVELSYADFAPVVAGTGTTYPITFPFEAGTVYDGILDVTTGKLTVTWAKKTLNGSEVWAGTPNSGWYTQDNNLKKLTSYVGHMIADTLPAGPNRENWLYGYNDASNRYPGENWFYYRNSNLTSSAQVKELFTANPTQVVYELATPVVYNLTPTEVKTLLGTNNIWADTGVINIKITEKGITAFELMPHI